MIILLIDQQTRSQSSVSYSHILVCARTADPIVVYNGVLISGTTVEYLVLLNIGFDLIKSPTVIHLLYCPDKLSNYYPTLFFKPQGARLRAMSMSPKN
jgi:hypothetical protein